MNAIESPEAIAERALSAAFGHTRTVAYCTIVDAIRERDRERDEQIGGAIFALATEWATTAPASSGGYVEALRKLAASLGGLGR